MKSIELKDFCNENLLDEKLFIVPTRTIGMQMQNKMARDGEPSINLRVVTLQGLAFEICEEYIINGNKLVIDDILGNNLVIDILKDLAKKDLSGFFFKPNLIDAKTAEEVYKVIMELKYGGLDIFPEIKNLDRIYMEYEKKLEELNAMDYCDIIIKATQLDSMKRYKNMKIAIAANIEFNNLEEMLFKALTEKNCTRIKMPVSSVKGHPKNYYYKENLDNIELKNKNIRFYDGYGTKEEIGFIIDDIKKKRIPLDDVVIAYTNNKYANLINIEFERTNIPITFGGGLSVEASSVYRFINTIFSWAQNYYNVDELRPIFANGDIKVDAKYNKSKGGISAPVIYEELVDCKILSLRKNYNRVLKLEEEGNDSIKEDINLKDFQRQKRIWLKNFINDSFRALPDEKYIRLNEYISKLRNLITKYVKNLNKYDGAAMQVVLQTLDKIQDINMEIKRDEYFDIVLSYVKQSKILRSQPQPGHVFAVNFRNAGYTGRNHLYLIGLDSDSLSNKVVESPILLDIMREGISAKISIANESYEYKKYKIRELLTAEFESISIGYSNFDTVDIKVKSPSQIYIELKDLIGENNYEDYGIGERIIRGRDFVKSATVLETLAECPRKLYLKSKMGLAAKEEVDIRVDTWLDGKSKGNIVHEVLSKYFDLSKEKQNREQLLTLLEDACAQYERDIVYLIDEAYRSEKENLIDTCEKIIEITRNDSEWEVLVNELSFGDKDKKDNKIFGPLPKQTIDIMGLELDIQGAIDRVDISTKDENLFRIVDYKTGNMENFDEALRLKITKKVKEAKEDVIDIGGYDYSETKKLQYYVYKKALEKILEGRKGQYEEAKVQRFTYIFEGHEKNGTIDLDFTEEFLNVIEARIANILDSNLLDLQSKAIYNPKDKTRCKYCDYGPICIVDKDLSKVSEGVEGDE